VTYILRFVNNARQPKKLSDESHIITVSQRCNIQPIIRDEQNQTIMRLIKLIQASYFAGELKLLTKLGCVTWSSPILRLNSFIDDSGILQVGRRLKSLFLPYTTKHPILLPVTHPFSCLIIKHEHEKHFYASSQAILAAIRQTYWLVFARNIVRQIIHK